MKIIHRMEQMVARKASLKCGNSCVRAKDDNSENLTRTPPKKTIDVISRKYSLKKIKIDGMPEPLFTKGLLFRAMIILLLTAVCAFVFPWIMSSGVARYRPRLEKWISVAQKELNALAIALGRYRAHVGTYPTSEEGLEVLACHLPGEVREMRRTHPTWDGPYITRIHKDPWGNKYVYEIRPTVSRPILYSCGPDRKAGTDDDLFAPQEFFNLPFQDTSWTNNWAPFDGHGPDGFQRPGHVPRRSGSPTGHGHDRFIWPHDLS